MDKYSKNNLDPVKLGNELNSAVPFLYDRDRVTGFCFPRVLKLKVTARYQPSFTMPRTNKQVTLFSTYVKS